MNDDDFTTLPIYDLKSQQNQPDVFTCQNCGIVTSERFGRCPDCGGRMMNFAETAEQVDGKKSGIGFVIVGIAYLLIPFIYFLSSRNAFDNLFTKASETDFMSVSKFTAIFAFPICFISIGIGTFLIKKDSLPIRFLFGGIAFALLIILDFFIIPALS